MVYPSVRRQRVRKGLIFAIFLLLPVILNYFSPYLIIDGASQGIVNGSFIVFMLLFFFSLLLGRAWCGWACPAAGLQESCFPVKDSPAKQGWRDWIKWVLWIVWIGFIIYAAISAGGYRKINFFHMTEKIISVSEPSMYIVYYFVIALFLLPALMAGRRAGCHYLCWMAPFMIMGRWLRNKGRWAALQLKADSDICTSCRTCESACPMGLAVEGMVKRGNMENTECVLCGSCVDACPQKTISWSFGTGKGRS